MISSSRSQRQSNGGFRVGDRVTFLLGAKTLHGVIVEDRGRFGAGGRQLFLVEVPLQYDNPLRVEMPADELEPESTARR